MGINLVGIRFLHSRISFRSHFPESLVVVRHLYGNTSGIKRPVALFHASAQGHGTDFGSFLQVNHRLHVILVESNPASGLVVAVARHTVYQRSGTLKLVRLIDRLQQDDRLRRRLAERHAVTRNARVAFRTHGHHAQHTCRIDGQPVFILGRSSGRFRTVEGIVHRCLVDGACRYIQLTRFRVGSDVHIHIEDMRRVVPSLQLINPGQTSRAFQESLIILLLFRSTPLRFTKRSHTRQYHVLCLCHGRDIFRPEVRLHTGNELLFFRRKGRRHRFIAVHPFHRQIAADGQRFTVRILCLIIVEIQVRVRRHDDIVLLTGRFNATGFPSPRHHRGVRSQTAFQDFIPANHAASVLGEELLGFVYHVALQILFLRVLAVALDAQRLDTCLTLRTSLPLHLRTFVATHMDVFRREDVDDFRQHILDEPDGLVVTRTKHVVGNTPHAPHFIRTARTSQFRISRQRRLHVTRKVDFRNDRDIAFRRVSHDFPGLFLRIETAVRLAVILARVTSDHRLAAFGADFRQLGILLDFDTPSLVFRQMPVEAVDVMQGQHVDVRLDFIHAEHVAAHIEHHATVAEARRVVDFHRRQFHGSCPFMHRHRLAERLDAIEHTRFRRSGNLHLAVVHLQPVRFRRTGLQPQAEHDALFPVTFRYLQRDARLFLDKSRQELGVLLHLVIPCRIADSFPALQQERTLRCCRNLQRHGHHLIVSHCRRTVRTRGHQHSGKCQPHTIHF